MITKTVKIFFTVDSLVRQLIFEHFYSCNCIAMTVCYFSVNYSCDCNFPCDYILLGCKEKEISSKQLIVEANRAVVSLNKHSRIVEGSK